MPLENVKKVIFFIKSNTWLMSVGAAEVKLLMDKDKCALALRIDFFSCTLLFWSCLRLS